MTNNQLADLTRAMLVGMVAMQTILATVVDVPLTKVGHNYALNFTINGGVYNNIVSVLPLSWGLRRPPDSLLFVLAPTCRSILVFSI